MFFSAAGWWESLKGRREKAGAFLDTGIVTDVVRDQDAARRDNHLTPVATDQKYLCTSNNQCASGWACVGGECVPVADDSGTTGGTSGPGDCNLTEDGVLGTCPDIGGPDACQEAATPGSCATDLRGELCCSEERCCTYGSLSSPFPGVNCYCGPCPQPACTNYCDAYLKANGVPDISNGCSEGLEGNSCDSCSFCEFGSCSRLELDDAPCWCDGGKACNRSQSCLTCDTDPGSSDFGECKQAEEDCQECVTISHACCDSFSVPEFTYCQAFDAPGPGVVESARLYAAKLCREKYKDKCQNEDGTGEWCYDSGNQGIECHCNADCGTEDGCYYCEASGTCQLKSKCQ